MHPFVILLRRIFRPHASPRSQRGVGALEYIAISAAIVTAIVNGARWWGMYGNSQDDTADAGQFQQAMKGASQYLNNNIGTITASQVIPWSTIASSMPVGLSSTNGWGQSYQLAVKVTGVAPNQTVNAMLQTVGGRAMPENRMRSVSRLVGTSGGYVTSLAPTLASGTNGAWSDTLTSYGGAGANPGVGHLSGALFYQTAATQNNSYLYRVSVPGQPQLNQMQTQLDMTGNNVVNAGNIATNTLTATGRIATNGLDPNDLPPTWGGGVRTWDVYAGGTVAAGTGGAINAGLDRTGAVWGANMAATNTISSNGTVWAAGNISTNSNVVLNTWGSTVMNPTGRLLINSAENLYLQPWSSGTTIVGGGGGSGNLLATGNIQANGYLQAGQIAWKGNGCGPNGAYGNDGQQALFCNNGVWTAVGGGGSAVAHCKGSSCSIWLPSAGTWDIFGVAYVHQYAWLGGWFYINGALVDTNANEGDQDGTGWGIMSGSYTIAVGGPTMIGASTTWNGTWGDFTISLHATKQ